MQITESIMINAPVERVFGIFTDLSQVKNRLSGIDAIEIIDGPEQMQVGTKWKETRTMMGKASTETMWVSKLTKDKSYAVDADSHGTKYHSEFTFTSEADATNVRWTFEGQPYTFFAKMMSLTAVLFSGSLKNMLRKDLEELKEACEH